MAQSATFGRRGVASAPGAAVQRPWPEARPSTPKPTPAPAPARVQPPAATTADDSLLRHFAWLLFSFRGRLDRRTYRYARVVANLAYLAAVYGLNARLLAGADNLALMCGEALLLLGLSGVMVWTTLAMQVKRRHDRDKSWPWLLVGFIPFVGPLWVLIECCWLEGTGGYNRFDDPAKRAAQTFS
jgi:uncharacterized membrane protein YhaH (DUF805 family)